MSNFEAGIESTNNCSRRQNNSIELCEVPTAPSDQRTTGFWLPYMTDHPSVYRRSDIYLSLAYVYQSINSNQFQQFFFSIFNEGQFNSSFVRKNTNRNQYESNTKPILLYFSLFLHYSGCLCFLYM